MRNRLTILIPGYAEENFGGAEYQAYLLAEAAKKSGHEVHFIFVTRQREFKNPNGFVLHPIKRTEISRRFGATWFLYSGQITRILDKIRPDVVYVRSGVSWAGFAARYARQRDCTSIWHVASSGDVIPREYRALITRPFDIVEERWIKYAITHATHVLAQANYQSALLMKHYRRISTVVMNQLPEPEEVLEKSGDVTIVWVANIKPLKQPEMFVRLARECLGEKNARFVMIGRRAGGTYQAKLEAEMRSIKNLSYLGEQTIQEVNALLARAHILVNTSTYEGLPNTFIQSWMREVPVVSMLFDPDDVLKAEAIGFCPGSFEQMVRDVRTLVGNVSLIREMGKRARRYALVNHSLEKNMWRFLEIVFGQNTISANAFERASQNT